MNVIGKRYLVFLAIIVSVVMVLLLFVRIDPAMTSSLSSTLTLSFCLL
jgi:hypothetical protein